DRGETTVVTNDAGAFVVTTPAGPLVAEVPAGAAAAGAIAGRMVLRASLEQILESGKVSPAVSITPLSTEVVRMMEADGLRYQVAKQMLARRITVRPDELLADPRAIVEPGARRAILAESFVLGRRFALAATMVDRGPITMKNAQQAAMNLEDIPRYD